MPRGTKTAWSEFINLIGRSLVRFGARGRVRQHYASFLHGAGIDFMDCSHPVSPEMQVKGEGHPNGKMNTLWAGCVRNTLESTGTERVPIP